MQALYVVLFIGVRRVYVLCRERALQQILFASPLLKECVAFRSDES